MPLNKWGSDILSSLKGKRLGLDRNDFLAGHSGDRIPYEASTAASTLSNSGMSVMSGTTAAWTLAAPLFAGIEKVLINASTVSTATLSVVRSTALGACSFLGSTDALGANASGARLNLIAAGAAVTMRSISSAVWAPIGNIGSSASYTVSTSS